MYDIRIARTISTYPRTTIDTELTPEEFYAIGYAVERESYIKEVKDFIAELHKNDYAEEDDEDDEFLLSVYTEAMTDYIKDATVRELRNSYFERAYFHKLFERREKEASIANDDQRKDG